MLSAVSVASELSVVEGRVPAAFPCSLGYQTLGCVTAAAPGTRVPTGTRVVTTTGHASGSVVPAARCIVVPEHVPDRVALAVILGEETDKGIRKVRPQPHERVIVSGAGLLGLLTVFNLTRRGVRSVTVTEPDAERRELARLFGATPTAPGTTHHADFDVGFECSASPDGFTELASSIRPHGRVCVLSDGNWGSLTLPRAFHERELLVVASSDGKDYQAYASWLWTHAEPILERLFEHTLTPDDLIPAFRKLTNHPRPVSVVVSWTTAASP